MFRNNLFHQQYKNTQYEITGTILKFYSKGIIIAIYKHGIYFDMNTIDKTLGTKIYL